MSSKVDIGTSLQYAINHNFELRFPEKIQTLLEKITDPSIVPDKLHRSYLMCMDNENSDPIYVIPLIPVYHITGKGVVQWELLLTVEETIRTQNVLMNCLYPEPLTGQKTLGQKVMAAEFNYGIEHLLCGKLLNTLFAAGEKISKLRHFPLQDLDNGKQLCPFRGPDENGEWLDYSWENTRSTCYLPALKQLARCTIREAIQKHDIHTNLYFAVKQIGLPVSLQKYLLYHQTEGVDEVFYSILSQITKYSKTCCNMGH